MVLKEGGVKNEKNRVVMNQLLFCFFFSYKRNKQMDAGSKLTWVLKQSPWRPGFKCVRVLNQRVLVSTCVCRAHV